MNRDAIRYVLDKHDIEYSDLTDEFLIKTGTIPNELVKEIGACDAAIEDHDMYRHLRIVNDE